jgi:hypothetical protein
MKLTYPTEWSNDNASGNEVPYSTQMSGISVIYPTGLDKIIYNYCVFHYLTKKKHQNI